MADDKSDFNDDRSDAFYDMNDYTPGKYDEMLASGGPGSPKRDGAPRGPGGSNLIDDQAECSGDDDDVGTCTDMGDYLDDDDDRDGIMGGGGDHYQDYGQEPIFDPNASSQDIRSFMSKKKK